MLNPGHYKKIDYTGLLGSFIASLMLHCALFAIVATTTIFYPPTADREYISVDLLFASPASKTEALPLEASLQNSSLAAAEDIAAAEPVPVKPAQTESSSELELLPVPTPKVVSKKTPTEKIKPLPAPPKLQKAGKPPPPSPVVIPAILKTPDAEPEETVKAATAEDVPSPEMELKAKSLLQTAQEQLAIENEKIRRQQEAELKAAEESALEEARKEEIAKARELEKLATARKLTAEKERLLRQQEADLKAAQQKALEEARAAKIAKAAELEKIKAEKARIKQLARLKAEEDKAVRDKLARERVEAEKAAKDKLEQARLAANIQKSINPLLSKPAGSPLTTGPAIVIAAATVTEKPQISVAPQPGNPRPENQPEHKGFALPPVNGDIKLIMTSEEDFIVKVLFVSHPKARHDKPLSKKEAKEQQKLTPIVVRTAKSTLEAVIERSREGIYIFLIEQKGSKPVNGKFSLKLFETKTKSVTGREISGQTEVARLLMPEGILWEDDSAFSGNIEDSDSMTKFNSDSGLVWKEYRR